jgi:uncharacterized protein (TIRG00374 family)
VTRGTVTALVVSLAIGLAAIALVALWLGPEALRGVGRIRGEWLAAALTLLATSWTLAGARLRMLVGRAGGRLPLRRGVRAHLVGLFASAVTPGGAGGMPAMVVTLAGQGLPQPRAWAVGIAATSADLAFIAWTTPLALLWLQRAGALPDRPWVIAAALVVTVASATAAVLLLLRLAWTRPIAAALLRGPLRRWRARALAGIERMLVARAALTAAPWGWHLRFHATVAAAWWTLFGVLWALARGFGVEASPLTVLAGLTLVQGVGAVVPTPGGSGAIELGATLALAGSEGRRGVAVAVLAWRGLTFYVLFLLGPAVGGYEVARAGTRGDEDA